MNSFRFIERGIRAEIARQEEILRGGRRGRAGDAALRPAHGARSRRCAPRRRRTTTATSRSPTSCRSRSPRRCSTRAGAALPELPAARAERFERDSGSTTDTRAPARLAPGAGRLLRGGAGDADGAPGPAAGQLGRRARRPHRRARTRPSRRSRPDALGDARGHGRARRRSRQRRGRAGARPAGGRGRRPRGDRRGRGPRARSAATTSSRPSSQAALDGQPRRRREAARAAT